MTEQEARDKWCPMARVSTYLDGNPAESAANRTDEGIPYAGSRCIASDCMMWRKQCFARHKETGDLYPVEVLLLGDDWETVENHGYCGLGGKP
jgi:hypothetical protein